MCGIAGFVNLTKTPPKKEILLKMTRVIKHRGPDDEGCFIDRSCALGIRRLSIIDIVGGKQPIHNEDRKITVVFNGEVYNFKILREALLAKGHRFKTKSDTEVIVHLYEEKGEKLFDLLEGMFAFAIWDSVQEKLILGRDRLGEKPLYYCLFDQTFIFASELKSLLIHPKVRREIDPDSLNRYLTFEYVPSPYSIFKKIYKLEPAHFLVLEKGKVRLERYWDPTFNKSQPGSLGETLEGLENLIDKSVKLRLVADVPVGVFLSGGIDSSTISYFAAKNSKRKIESFSIGFEEESFDERRYAQHVASQLGLHHNQEVFNMGTLLNLIPQVTKLLDEPFADPSILPTYLVSQFAKERVKVVLGGDGGDELFMGYPTFQAHKMATLYGFIPRFIHDRFVSPIVRSLPVSYSNFSFDFKAKKVIEGIFEEPAVRNQIWLGAFTNSKTKKRLFTKNFKRQIKKENPIEELVKSKVGDKSGMWESLIYQYLKTYLPEDVLFKIDRASMYNSLEVRSPFLDHNLVDFVNSIPAKLKLHAFTTKYVLKKLMEKKLPREIIYRPKHGFGIPIASWFRRELKPFLLEILDKKKIRREGIFNPSCVEEILSEHILSRRDNRKLLWTLLMFELWRENWMS